MATFRAVILKGGRHVKNDGTSNIKIRITHNRESEYISTDLYIIPDNFKNGYASGDNSAFINMRISDYLAKYQRRYINLGDTASVLSVKELKQEISTDRPTDISFFEFAEKYIKELEADGKTGSLHPIRGLLANLREFRSVIFFSDINAKFLRGFENYMKRKGVGNGAQTYISRLRIIFNKGREYYNDEDRGILKIPNYPFRTYKIATPVVNANENSLSVDQVRQIINYHPHRIREKLAKDMFILMIYLMGINSKDLFKLSIPGKDGRIAYHRSKTGRRYSINPEPEAQDIISRYQSKERLINASERYTDHLNFQRAVNRGLLVICDEIRKNEIKTSKRAHFPEKITSNWARHTWATIARNDCRVHKDDVALCLGHEDQDNRVTDMYIKYDYSIIDRSNRKVIDFITNSVI